MVLEKKFYYSTSSRQRSVEIAACGNESYVLFVRRTGRFRIVGWPLLAEVFLSVGQECPNYGRILLVIMAFTWRLFLEFNRNRMIQVARVSFVGIDMNL